MADLGWQELAIILVVVIIIFGAGKLPEIGGALGKGIKEFKSNVADAGEPGPANVDDEPVALAAAAEGGAATTLRPAPSVGDLRAEEI